MFCCCTIDDLTLGSRKLGRLRCSTGNHESVKPSPISRSITSKCPIVRRRMYVRGHLDATWSHCCRRRATSSMSESSNCARGRAASKYVASRSAGVAKRERTEVMRTSHPGTPPRSDTLQKTKGFTFPLKHDAVSRDGLRLKLDLTVLAKRLSPKHAGTC
jgi:hypothetical protein